MDFQFFITIHNYKCNPIFEIIQSIRRHNLSTLSTETKQKSLERCLEAIKIKLILDHRIHWMILNKHRWTYHARLTTSTFTYYYRRQRNRIKEVSEKWTKININACLNIDGSRSSPGRHTNVDQG